MKTFALVVITAALAASAIAQMGFPPIDPQKVQDQDDMTWNDYHAIPGVNWADGTHKPTQRTIRIALVLADFDDQPFVITLPKKSDLFGNPQMDPIKREDVAKFYADFWNKPQPINHGHTVNEYWLELSHGQIGVEFDSYGPYHMPKKMIDYPEAAGGGAGNRRGGAATNANITATEGGGATNEVVATSDANSTNAATGGRRGGRGGGRGGGSSLSGDLDAMWRPDSNGKQYDLVLRVYAGYDETCVWQEFGEMKFQTRDDIPPEWGNPDPTQPRWSRTRYVAWTSWKAASYLWSNSAIINGESSGSIRHEISHAAFRIGDNNNNPYVEPYRRCGAGPWDVMDRGSFNGPGGPHNRWEIPVTQGGSMPAGLMLRQMLYFKFLTTNQTVQLNRNGLAKSGLAVARITAREVEPPPGTFAGIVVHLDGEAPQDRTPADDPSTNALSSGVPNYSDYTLEVVQRIGYDSFCPDSGVLLAKNKDRPSAVGGPNSFTCFNWTIDAHPEDINKVDYIQPGTGKKIMRTVADYRQLNDALFHAGTRSGSQYEWEDAPNHLHFYVVDVQVNPQGILSYTLGVRSLDGAGPQKRGVSLTAPSTSTASGPMGLIAIKLTNTGSKADTDASLHPTDASAVLDSDIYRISVACTNVGWGAELQNELAAVKFGESKNIPVTITTGTGAGPSATLTVTAKSESDPSKTATAIIRLNY